MYTVKHMQYGGFFKKSDKGFTIVELLIVIVVIAILAAITIVAYNGIQERANASVASSAANQAAKKVSLYYADHDTYPASLGAAGIVESDNLQYTVSNAANPKMYCITALSGSKAYYINSTTATSPKEGGCVGHTQGGVDGQEWVTFGNMVPNGSFEQDSEGLIISTYSNRVQVSDAKYGRYVAQLNPPASGNNHIGTSSITVTQGKKYCISVWVRKTTAGATGSFLLYAQGVTPLSPASVSVASLSTNSWQQLAGAVTATATGAIYFGPYLAGGAAGGGVQMDGVSMVECI